MDLFEKGGDELPHGGQEKDPDQSAGEGGVARRVLSHQEENDQQHKEHLDQQIIERGLFVSGVEFHLARCTSRRKRCSPSGPWVASSRPVSPRGISLLVP